MHFAPLMKRLGKWGQAAVVALIVLSLQPLSTSLASAQARSSEREAMLRKSKDEMRNPYWDGFIDRANGDCPAAVEKFRPIALTGTGFEDLQTALAMCLMNMAGYNHRSNTIPLRKTISKNLEFIEGRDWLVTAAQAGYHEAQAELIRLYRHGLGPISKNSKIANPSDHEASKWTHLYLTNPIRLSLGAANIVSEEIEYLKQNLDRQAWFEGKETARKWFPTYMQSSVKPNPPQKMGMPRQIKSGKP